ncbi:MAG: hypothetical protein NT062_35865 [Proteobacteria bacterium]|nr:hypothetical protein [Pseudomonadota bacterium]
MAEHALTELVVDLLVDGGYLRRCPRHKAVILDDGDGGSCVEVAAALRPAERLRFDSREHLEIAIQHAVAMAGQHCLLCIQI